MTRQKLYSIRLIIIANTFMVLNAFALGINGPAATNTGMLDIRQVSEKLDDFVAFATIMQFGCVDVGPAACGRKNEADGIYPGWTDVQGAEGCYGGNGGNGLVARIC